MMNVKDFDVWYFCLDWCCVNGFVMCFCGIFVVELFEGKKCGVFKVWGFFK